MWLVIPAAVGLFVLRTVLIARKLKLAAANAGETERLALREARRGLHAHREHLEGAIAAPKQHLAAAKGLGRAAMSHAREPKGLDAMVGEFLPEQRL